MSIWNNNNRENNIKPVLKVCDFSQLLNRLIGEATKAHAKHHTALLLLSMHCTSKKDHKTSHLTETTLMMMMLTRVRITIARSESLKLTSKPVNCSCSKLRGTKISASVHAGPGQNYHNHKQL